jgi:hypothetical protein
MVLEMVEHVEHDRALERVPQRPRDLLPPIAVGPGAAAPGGAPRGATGPERRCPTASRPPRSVEPSNPRRPPAPGNPGDAAGGSAARRASSPASARSAPAAARRWPRPAAGDCQGNGRRSSRWRSIGRNCTRSRHGTPRIRASARRWGPSGCAGAGPSGLRDAEGPYNVEQRTVRRYRPQPGRSLERPVSTFEGDSAGTRSRDPQPGRSDKRSRRVSLRVGRRVLDRRRLHLEPGREIPRLHRSILGPKCDDPGLRSDSRRSRRGVGRSGRDSV